MEKPAATPLDALRTEYESRPDDTGAAARLAEHYADLGWFNESLDVYREALARHPGEMSLLIGFGNTCFRHRDFKEAHGAFTRLTEVRPERIEGWNNLGIVRMAMGDDDGAREAFERVLSMEPENAGTLINLGNCHARKGNTAAARNCFQEATAIKPDYADGWFNLGNVFLDEKDFENAGRAFEKALKYQREFPSALKNLGFVHEQRGDLATAAACYRQAGNLEKADAGIQINLANACMSLAQYEEARICFLTAVRLSPRNTAGWMGLRHIALMKGDMPAYLRATLAILPHLSAEAVATTVDILLGLGHAAEAREVVAGADRCGKAGDLLDAQRLVVYRTVNIESERQTALFTRLCALADPPGGVHKALAKYAYACGDFAEAIRFAGTVPDKDIRLMELIIRSYCALRQFATARKLLSGLLEKPSENGTMLFLAARCELELGHAGEAGKYFVEAIENGFSSLDEVAAYPAFSLLYERMGTRETPEATASVFENQRKEDI